MVLNGQKQRRDRLVKFTLQQIGFADRAQGRTHSLARAQSQRGLDVHDREIGLTGPEPEDATEKPAAREARG